MFKKYIIENKVNDITIVGDRSYFSYELLKFLIDININFIIRCKDVSKNLDFKSIIKGKNKDIINYIKNNSSSVIKY